LPARGVSRDLQLRRHWSSTPVRGRRRSRRHLDAQSLDRVVVGRDDRDAATEGEARRVDVAAGDVAEKYWRMQRTSGVQTNRDKPVYRASS